MSATSVTGAPSTNVPMGVRSRYRPPRGCIDPDRNKSWLRRALPVLKEHRIVFSASIGASLLGLVIQLEVPTLLKDAIDNSIVFHRVPLHFYVWWVLVLAIATGLFGYVARSAMYRTAYDIEFHLRNLIYQHLVRMSFDFYDRVQTGQLISRANSDIRSVQMYLTFAPLILVQCAGAIVAFGFMLAINWLLALAAMAVSPFVYLMGLRMRQAIFPISWVIQARLAEVATIVDENVNGVRVVKSFAAEPQQLTLLAKAADRLQWAYIKDADVRARFTPAMQNLPQLGLVIVLLVGGWMVVHGHLGVGAIVAFNLYLFMVQLPFMMLGMLVMMGQRAAASAQRIYEILDERPTMTQKPGAIELAHVQGEVRFENVTFTYPGSFTPVLAGFDLRISPGETVALVGRTGSGKSTVARLLDRFYDVDSGAVKIDGHDVRDVTLTSLRAAVGIVLDEPFLFSASISDNIAFGRPDASDQEIEAAARAAGADGFIRAMPEGYDTVVGERGYTLSGGQRQRLAIARTLLLNPPVLVLDDATSAIDVQVELQIHEALRKLMEGRTTLVIAHRLSTIGLADRVVLIEGGRVVAEGTHNELLDSVPLYGEVLAQGKQSGAEP